MSHVLLIDDDPDSLMIVEMILSRADFEVTKAISGEQALAAVATFPSPDLVLLDAILPDMDGYDICRHIRANYPNLPIIFFTARTESAAINAARSAGATGYLAKPVSAAKLVASIRQHLPSEHMRRYT